MSINSLVMEYQDQNNNSGTKRSWSSSFKLGELSLNDLLDQKLFGASKAQIMVPDSSNLHYLELCLEDPSGHNNIAQLWISK